VPFVPGHFTRYEWMALALWAALGASIRVPENRKEGISKQELDVPDLSSQTPESRP